MCWENMCLEGQDTSVSVMSRNGECEISQILTSESRHSLHQSHIFFSQQVNIYALHFNALNELN